MARLAKCAELQSALVVAIICGVDVVCVVLLRCVGPVFAAAGVKRKSFFPFRGPIY